MDRLYEICDEMASQGRFVKFRDIMERYYGREITKLDGDTEYERLRRRLSLDRCHGVVEFQNDSGFKGGFRYKKGKEYFLTNYIEKKIHDSKEGDERKLFMTGGLQALFDGDTSVEHLVEMECVEELKNLNLVKVITNYLSKLEKPVFSFRYHQGFDNFMDVTMFPHLLKEFNSRWFLFGYVMENGNPKVVNFSLDRIVYEKPSDIKLSSGGESHKPPRGLYKKYFKDIVGVTRFDNSKVETYTIRTTDFKVHHLLRTKPIHSSQKETFPFDVAKGIGEFTIRVIHNPELRAKLMGYGSGLYVVGDGEFQQEIREHVAKMAEYYHIRNPEIAKSGVGL